MARSMQLSGQMHDIHATLSLYRFGSYDPTTRLEPGRFRRATLTPDGPGTMEIRWSSGGTSAEAWGDGASWLLSRVQAMVGADDPPHRFDDAHPAILQAQRNHPDLRLGRSETLYHELLPTILGQRITAGEAVTQWRRLVRAFNDPAPGPYPDLLLPPPPAQLAARPTWWFHQHGIEVKRAKPLIEVARQANRLWAWATLPPAECAAKLGLLQGVGPWTIGSVLAPALGDHDAVAVGDFHLKNIVAFALAGEPRGTDERMLELLQPYAGQRGRVVRLLMADGRSSPSYGPRQRVVDMRRW